MKSFALLAQLCAPDIDPVTLAAIAFTESGMEPYAIGVNGAKLARQPRSRREAVAWATWLMTQGYSVDLGLMQINDANLDALSLDVASAFDPCKSTRAAAQMLRDDYSAARRAHGRALALGIALSRYNTGRAARGFANGYVGRVLANRHRARRLLAPATD